VGNATGLQEVLLEELLPILRVAAFLHLHFRLHLSVALLQLMCAQQLAQQLLSQRQLQMCWPRDFLHQPLQAACVKTL
jgi:hypothetical protein